MCVQIIYLEIPESRSWNDGTESPSCHVIHITFMQLEYKLLKIQVHTSPLVLVDLSAVLLFGFLGNHTVILIFPGKLRNLRVLKLSVMLGMHFLHLQKCKQNCTGGAKHAIQGCMTI